MDYNLDKTENFLAAVSINFDHSACETITVFSTADQSTNSSSRNGHQTLARSDPLFSTIRQWLHDRSTSLPDEESSNKSKPDESKSDPIELGLCCVEMAATTLETVIQNKEDLRHHLKIPLAENCIRLHFNQHRDFLDVIQCLTEVGKKYEDYSLLTSDYVILSMQWHIKNLEEEEKIAVELQNLSTNTAADTEEIRNKKILCAP
ncbi:uncharacterized protein LOC130690174 [Daphnia carinata]|uniref:uncharacterized protein LOC130690174 n=1 Tax=Daphnia carinata TaxID=120202 RepID=UPI00257FADD5|nr:uncharacterized protein LOC130690174 [Daphnia carinata]